MKTKCRPFGAALTRTLAGLSFTLCVSALTVHANLTNLVIEPFQGYGQVTSNSPDAFSYVGGGGIFYKNAIGPRTNGDTSADSMGWGASISPLQTAGWWALTNGYTQAENMGLATMWVYPKPDNNAGTTYFFNIYATNGTPGVAYAVATNYIVCNGVAQQYFPPYQWYKLGLSWYEKSSGIYDFQCWIMTNGQSIPSIVYAVTNGNMGGGASMGKIVVGEYSYQNAYFTMKIGRPALFTYSTEYVDITNGLGV